MRDLSQDDYLPRGKSINIIICTVVRDVFFVQTCLRNPKQAQEVLQQRRENAV